MKTYLFFLAFIFGLVTQAAPTNELALSQEGGLVDIRDAFQKRTAAINQNSKDFPRERFNVLLKTLDECGEPSRQKEFDYIISHPATNSDATFDDLVAQAFVVRLSKAWDTNALKHLLSVRCPEYIVFTPIEFGLARRKGAESILLLLDAYSMAGTNYASQVLLRRLGCAFPKLREQYPDDRQFTGTCKRWVINNSEGCILNLNYVQPINISSEEMEKWKNPSLFTTRGR